MKHKHVTLASGSKAWKCPNPKCRLKGRSFLRNDRLLSHRKECNPTNLCLDPNFVPLPDIEEGSDEELKRWMKAAAGQRGAIRRKLRAGTPWSVDLLQPVYI
jgi:hypothetical protein